MLTIFPVCPAANSKLVWRQRNAGNLKDIRDAGDRSRLINFVDVCKDRKTGLVLHTSQLLESAVQARAPG